MHGNFFDGPWSSTKSLTARAPPPSLPHQLLPQLYDAALMAVQASRGSLELTAQILARLGYSVTLNTSAGGTLHSLKHRYLTATRTSMAGSQG